MARSRNGDELRQHKLAEVEPLEHGSLPVLVRLPAIANQEIVILSPIMGSGTALRFRRAMETARMAVMVVRKSKGVSGICVACD